jgi:hypothetical protein
MHQIGSTGQMAIFAIMAANETTTFEYRIKAAFPSNHLKLAAGQWLVSAGNLTSKEISERLSVEDAGVGFVFVASISSYWGWHPPNVWEWMESRFGK